MTAPDSFGFLKGATLNLGTVLNIDNGGQNNYYAGVTIPTPMSALKFGAAFDLVSVNNAGVNQDTPAPTANPKNDSGWVAGIYASYQATDKLSLNLRGEYFDLASNPANLSISNYHTNGKGEELTATISYNLWANVTSRAEFRWDHDDQGRLVQQQRAPTPTPSCWRLT